MIVSFLDFATPVWHLRPVGITPQQFEQLQNRVRGGGRAPVPLMPAGLRPATSAHQIILGIDPSLRGTGFGIIQISKPFPRTLAQGTIVCSAGWEPSRCLVRIAETIRAIVKEHRPTLCVIEGLFYAQNLRTALVMGEARGAALVAVAESGLEIHEIATRKVKQAIVGYGAAQKIAVAKMVQRLLNLAEPPAPDAADALALALAHVQENGRYSLTVRKRI